MALRASFFQISSQCYFFNFPNSPFWESKKKNFTLMTHINTPLLRHINLHSIVKLYSVWNLFSYFYWDFSITFLWIIWIISVLILRKKIIISWISVGLWFWNLVAMSNGLLFSMPRIVMVDNGFLYRVLYEDGTLLSTTSTERIYWLRQELLHLVSVLTLYQVFCHQFFNKTSTVPSIFYLIFLERSWACHLIRQGWYS